MELLMAIGIIILVVIGICGLGVLFKIAGFILDIIIECFGWFFSGCFSIILFIFVILFILCAIF